MQSRILEINDVICLASFPQQNKNVGSVFILKTVKSYFGIPVKFRLHSYFTKVNKYKS